MRVLIVEDDINLNKGIGIVLEELTDEICSAHTLEEAKEIVLNEEIDLMVLDLNLPDGDGLDFIKYLRNSLYSFPIIILSARSLESDMILGLKLGADDYLIKPFSLIVLKEKIRAIMKRINKEEHFTYEDEHLNFNFDKLKFFVDGREVDLSKTEIKILQKLIANRDIIVKRENLIDAVWGLEGEFVDTNALSVAINRLRKKIVYKEKIHNEYGVGYIWKS
ncbi:response regulator transcription factor [Anaerosphaera multitolerans]|nr:response regulator transcription factor [Anaerosphaera multitolerans]